MHRTPAIISCSHALSGVFPLAAKIIDVPRLQDVDSILGGNWSTNCQLELAATGIDLLLKCCLAVWVDLDVGIAKAANASHCSEVLLFRAPKSEQSYSDSE
jgi:hypothetical protein